MDKKKRLMATKAIKTLMVGVMISSSMLVVTMADASSSNVSKSFNYTKTQSVSSIPITLDNKKILMADSIHENGTTYISLIGIVEAVNDYSKLVYQGYQAKVYIAYGSFHFNDGFGWGNQENYPTKHQSETISLPLQGVDAWKSGKIHLKIFFDKKNGKWVYGVDPEEFAELFNNFADMGAYVNATWNGSKLNFQIPSQAYIRPIPFAKPTIAIYGNYTTVNSFTVDPTNQSLGIAIVSSESSSSENPIVYSLLLINLINHQVIYSESLPDSLFSLAPPYGVIGFIHNGSDAVISGSGYMDLFSIKDRVIRSWVNYGMTDGEDQDNPIQIIHGTHYMVIMRNSVPTVSDRLTQLNEASISIVDTATGEISHKIFLPVRGIQYGQGVYLKNGYFVIPYRVSYLNGVKKPFRLELMVVDLKSAKYVTNIPVGYMPATNDYNNTIVAALPDQTSVVVAGQISYPVVNIKLGVMDVLKNAEPSLYFVNVVSKRIEKIISIPYQNGYDIFSPIVSSSPNNKIALLTGDSSSATQFFVLNLATQSIEYSVKLQIFNPNWGVGKGISSMTFTPDGKTVLIENDDDVSSTGDVSIYSLMKKEMVSTKIIGYYPLFSPSISLNSNTDIWIPSEWWINNGNAKEDHAQLTLIHLLNVHGTLSVEDGSSTNEVNFNNPLENNLNGTIDSSANGSNYNNSQTSM
jgi:hypothetical protein